MEGWGSECKIEWESWENERMKEKSYVKWNERMRKWMKEWESKCKIKWRTEKQKNEPEIEFKIEWKVEKMK
jgi:hypothetical protein